MSYERPGFDPTNPHDKTFDVYHTGADGIYFHIIGLSKLMNKVDSGEHIPLINYQTEQPENPVKHVQASLRSGRSLLDEDAFLYNADIRLHGNGGDAYRKQYSRLINSVGNDDLSIRNFTYDEVRLITSGREESAISSIYYSSSRHAIEVRNQATFRSDLQDRRLSAPKKNAETALKEHLHFLASVAIGIQVGTALDLGEFRELPGTYDFVITPSGPLHRNPDTGEYVHRLERDRIAIGAATRKTVEKDTADEHAKRIEDTRFEDLYGMETTIARLHPYILFYKHPEIANKWRAKKPSGLLIEGPPGGGKTSLIYALGNEIGAAIHEVKGDEMYGRFVGDSQKQAEELFNKFRDATTPTIVLFDELESLVTVDESGGSSGSQAINGVAGIFKREVARISNANPNVIFAATTNNTDRVDPALIRAGRFDMKIKVGRPDDESRQKIFCNLFIKNLDMDIDPSAITDAGIVTAGRFQIYESELLTTTALTKLSELTADFSPIDIKTVIDKAAIKKAIAESQGEEVGPISLDDLVHEIFDYRRS